MTSTHLFLWSQENIPKIKFKYCINLEYIEEEVSLKYCQQETETIKGTGIQQFYTYIPLSSTKIFSVSEEFSIQEIVEGSKSLSMQEISGYVTFDHDRRWWLASVLSEECDNREVEVTFLHPSHLHHFFPHGMQTF